MDDGQKTANEDYATTGAGSSQLQVFPLERAECGERGGEFFFSLLFGNELVDNNFKNWMKKDVLVYFSEHGQLDYDGTGLNGVGGLVRY